ncbi:GTP-binding protein [Corynebacterium falsenii DSM 44353]|uniref:GTPase HflX n=1 Tax=Corynebacterium falsenii TaxID=108486 RepID=UPI0003E95572|nr:GTPase HflX [Corynebacterium falsenii]AHI03251.1 GTP-binding protein [Corynebacterium falsenii DSM 44353]MDC7103425.1 GTPase HflX [Corynebacterium falsenii]UBI03947.1 GTPase HflX [Corynebacterium falsenii]UBI06041.1 GTPase HflX [Corynebacterium falsenii]
MTDFSQHNFTERDAANSDDYYSDDYYDAVHGANQNPRHDPTVGELDLEARSSLRRLTRGVSSYTDEQSDGYDVEYRKLRLEKVVLVGVWTEGTVAQIEARLEELAALAETAGSDIVDMLYQRRDKPDAGTYIGRGKVEELKSIVAETGADTVICDGELSPGQMIALEKALNVKVIDRTMLILDIFAQHAKSKEGKAQVALAQMEYLITRVRGWGGALSRQAGGRAGSNGGVGLRGPGETKIEADRRRLRSEMAKLRKEIAGMKTSRDIKRERRDRAAIPQVAIAGYTNAGKSSLINALTGAGVLVEDALFATLDPTTRRASLADGRTVVFSDTVGFVRHLPTQLVEAFRSTLEEVLAADVVLHVVDGSDPFPLEQIQAVNKVINEIVEETGRPAPPEIMVVNKIDKADPLVLAELRAAIDDVVFVSAHTGEGIKELEARLEVFLNTLDKQVTLHVPFDRGDVVARLHELGTVLDEQYDEQGTRVEVRVPAAVANELASFEV